LGLLTFGAALRGRFRSFLAIRAFQASIPSLSASLPP
jgi:hypothetical protein